MNLASLIDAHPLEPRPLRDGGLVELGGRTEKGEVGGARALRPRGGAWRSCGDRVADIGGVRDRLSGGAGGGGSRDTAQPGQPRRGARHASSTSSTPRSSSAAGVRGPIVGLAARSGVLQEGPPFRRSSLPRPTCPPRPADVRFSARRQLAQSRLGELLASKAGGDPASGLTPLNALPTIPRSCSSPRAPPASPRAAC